MGEKKTRMEGKGLIEDGRWDGWDEWDGMGWETCDEGGVYRRRQKVTPHESRR